MHSSDPAPKLPTWIFIVTDLALIGIAATLAAHGGRPLPSGTVFAITTCVVLGAIVGLIPLVARYEREKNRTLDDRQRALETLATTLASSAEQISIATGSLHGIAELAHKNLRQAEHLPHKLQEKIAEFQALRAATDDAEKEELEKELTALRTTESERLETLSTRLAKLTAEWTKLESETGRHLAAAQAAIERIPAETARLEARFSEIESRLTAAARAWELQVEKAATTPREPAAPTPPVHPAPASPPSEAATPQPPASASQPAKEDPPPAPEGSPSSAGPAAPPPPPPPPAPQPAPGRAARASKKAPPEPSLELGLDLSASTPSGPVESTLSSDGATRLLVTAYVGIGNKLFIRGDGPGLDWNKGAPLQFVSIGKWRWETSDASAPVRYKLYKNDEVECASLGLQTVEPGHLQEINASF